MNRANNHNSNPPKLIQSEYDGITYIFNGYFGDWSDQPRHSDFLNPDNWSVCIPVKPVGIKRRRESWDLEMKVDLPFQGEALIFAPHKPKQDNWEAELILMKSIEVNRKKFQEWLDYKCLALKYSDMHTMDDFYDWQRDYFKIPKIDINAPSLDIKSEPVSPWGRLYYFGVDPICKPII